MSGAEVVGLIAATLEIIETVKNVYNGLRDAEHLPQAFREVVERLPLVQKTLEVVERHMESIDSDAEKMACQAMKVVVDNCKAKAKRLEEIFSFIVPSDDTPRFERYRMVVRRLGKENKVEVLAKEMMNDARLLAENRAVQAATQAQIAQLYQAIEDLSQLEPSLPDEDSINQSHSGSGDNVAGNKYEGNHNEYHGSGSAYFAPVTQHVQIMKVRVAEEIRRNPLRECLKSLSFPRMIERPSDIETEAAGTCAWLLQHPVYAAWISQTPQAEGILCIKGKPGSGKSTLLRYTLSNIVARHAPEEGVFLSFFFHGRGAHLQSTPLGLLRALLYQLLSQVPQAMTQLVATFQERCETFGRQGREWEWQYSELQRFLQSSLREILQTHQVWLFVDALDECQQNGAEMVAELKSLSERLRSFGPKPFRSCFTGRHYPPILDFSNKSTILLDIENNLDIALFVRLHLSTAQPDSELANLIIARAQGVFLWARLVLKQIRPLLQEGASTTKIKAAIERIPEGFNTIYGEIMKNVRHPSATQKLLQWICFSIRPLTTDELRWAMVVDTEAADMLLHDCEHLEDFITPDKVDRRIKALSCGLAETVLGEKSCLVRFIHPSVKDFLVAGGLTTLGGTAETPGVMVSAVHSRLSRICVSYIRMVARSHTLPLSNGSQSKFPFLQYATTSWMAHARLGAMAEGSPGVSLGLLRQLSVPFMESWVRFYQQIEPSALKCPSTGSSLLHVASRYGLEDLMSSLLFNMGKAGVDARDVNDETPLLCAARHGQAGAVKLLLATGKASLKARDKDGRTPLACAAMNGHAPVVKLFLDTHDVDIDTADHFNWTPLSLATARGHAPVIELLLEANNIDVSVRDTVYSQTPLSWAARNGHVEVVDLLLRTNRVEANTRDKLDRTPFSRAAEQGHTAVIERLLQVETIDADTKDAVYHQTPLSWASRCGRDTVVELLLHTEKVNVYATDGIGRTPLALAAEGGHASVVRLILDKVDGGVDAKDGVGRTALSRAAEQGHFAVVKLLIDTGKVNPRAGDSSGRTPLSWAAKSGQTLLIRMLSDMDFCGTDATNGQTEISPSSEEGYAVYNLINDPRWNFKDKSLFPRPKRFVGGPKKYRSGESSSMPLDLYLLAERAERAEVSSDLEEVSSASESSESNENVNWAPELRFNHNPAGHHHKDIDQEAHENGSDLSYSSLTAEADGPTCRWNDIQRTRKGPRRTDSGRLVPSSKRHQTAGAQDEHDQWETKRRQRRRERAHGEPSGIKHDSELEASAERMQHHVPEPIASKSAGKKKSRRRKARAGERQKPDAPEAKKKSSFIDAMKRRFRGKEIVTVSPVAAGDWDHDLVIREGGERSMRDRDFKEEKPPKLRHG